MLFFGTENLSQFLSPSRGIACLIRMPLVKSFCHTNSAQLKMALPYQEVRGLLYFLQFFFSPTGIFRYIIRESHKITQALALKVFTLDTNRPLDMDEPYLAGKVIIAIYSRVTLQLFIISKLPSLKVSILMGGCKVPFC